MLQLEQLDLHDYALYKEQSFRFEEGMTVIRGQNFSGKSLLFQPLRTILFDEGSVPTGGKAVLTGAKGSSFSISAYSTGKSNRYGISIDGVDQRTDTIAKAREVIDRQIDLPSSLYTTTIGLTGLSPHPLASGKPSTRLEWVHATLAFAEMYDAYTEKVEARIKETKTKAIEHSVVSKELSRLLSEEPEVPSDLPERDTSVSERLSKLQKRRDELSLLVHRPPRPDRDRADIERKLSRCEAELVELESLSDKWKAYRRKLSEWKSQRDEIRDTTDKMEELFRKLKVPEALHANYSKLASSITKQVSNVNRSLEDADRTNRLYEEQREVRDILRNAPPTNLSLEEATKKLREVRDRLSYYKVSLSSVGDVCIFCNKDLSSSKKKALEDVDKLRERRDDLVSTIAFHEASSVDLVKRVDVDPLERKLRSLQSLNGHVSFLLDVGVLSKPDKPKTEFDESRYDRLRSIVVSCKERLSEWTIYEKWESRVPEHLRDVANPEKEFERITSKISELTAQVSSLSDKMIRHRTAVALRDRWEKDVASLTSRVQELSKYPKRMKVLGVLKSAFGRDGIRAETLSSAMEVFLANLNNLASIIWPEPYKFEIDVGPRKCDVIVHRNKRSGSIFSLSGAEQRGWQLISALSLIRLLPDNSRCDTIILDELEANSSKETRNRFVYDFLPELLRSVPKVVIVTPLSSEEFGVPCDREFAVVKNNSQSSLKLRK